MGYSEQEVLNKCRVAFTDIPKFYQQPFVNYNGKTEDTNTYYTEVVAAFLTDNITAFVNGIPRITRNASYQTKGHDGAFTPDTPREEERIAIEMFNQSQRGSGDRAIGDIIDYQTPLKNRRSDVAGKADLLSYDGATLRILELKKPHSTESMLRCVLEGFTYLQTVDTVKLLHDFSLSADTAVKASPLVFKNQLQHRQMTEERPHLLKLMRLLDSKPYYVTKENNVYKVEAGL